MYRWLDMYLPGPLFILSVKVHHFWNVFLVHYTTNAYFILYTGSHSKQLYTTTVYTRSWIWIWYFILFGNLIIFSLIGSFFLLLLLSPSITLYRGGVNVHTIKISWHFAIVSPPPVRSIASNPLLGFLIWKYSSLSIT